MTRARFPALLSLALVAAACFPVSTKSPGIPTERDDRTAAPGSGSTRTGAPSASFRFPPDPDATAYAPRDPMAPGRRQGTVHDLELSVRERFGTVAAGFVQALWTFEGMVPGPVIRVGEGDRVRIHLVNAPPAGTYPAQHPAVNLFPHAVEFLGSTGARLDQTTPIAPLRDRTFELSMDRAGVWLYRGSTEPIVRNIVTGLYGMVIVEPAAGLAPVDQEIFLVQGEWYLGGQYRPNPPLPSVERATAPLPDPDFVVFNGIAEQYRDHPIRLRTGARVRAFILNAGPNVDCTFRVDRTTLHRVPGPGGGASVGERPDREVEAVRVAVGEGAIVEFTLTESGVYRFMGGDLDEPGRGPVGYFLAEDGGT